MITFRHLSLNFFSMLKNSLNCNNRGPRVTWGGDACWIDGKTYILISEFLSFAIYLQTKPLVTSLVTQAELTKKSQFFNFYVNKADENRNWWKIFWRRVKVVSDYKQFRKNEGQ